jgi:4-amino-4-deoxy-L-arabinose transferase-like glycosyltransferase
MKFKNWLIDNKWLCLILIIASFLRIFHADFQSLWLDEILSMKDANPSHSFNEFYDGIMFWEFIPHLYFYLLKILFQIFGYSTLVGRLFSALIGIVGVYAVYLLGKELNTKKTGLIAASIVTVNIFHIQYSQEIRPYGLLFLFTVIAFYRLSVFIRTTTLKNSLIYGFFAGLILNAHFFGFITLFSQYLILLVSLIYSEKENRKKLFLCSFYSSIITLIVFIPVYEPFIRASKINSFWLQKPGLEVYTNLFKEFFGNSEIILLIIQFVVMYYFLKLFNQKIKDFKTEKIIKYNNQTYSFIFLLIWLTVSLTIPLIKSHLDVPMILSRYLINILPVIIIIIAYGINLIKNKVVKHIIVLLFICFSLIDVFVVKNYYNTVSKSQFRELTNEIQIKNPNNSKIVCYWSWLFPYFFQNTPTSIEGKSLEDYVLGLKNNATSKDSFWYADANSRPYSLSIEDESYLEKHFVVKERLQFFDAWANYYVSKTEKISKSEINLKSFNSKNYDQEGNILLFENTILTSKTILIEKGTYELIINGLSLPETPINGENAQLKIKINGNEIGKISLSNLKNLIENKIIFNQKQSQKSKIRIIYYNDLFENEKDRNLILYSIILNKK